MKDNDEWVKSFKEMMNDIINDFTKIADEKNKYMLRNMKAIEYLKEHSSNTWYYVKKNSEKFMDYKIIKCSEELLDILEGKNER